MSPAFHLGETLIESLWVPSKFDPSHNTITNVCHRLYRGGNLQHPSFPWTAGNVCHLICNVLIQLSSLGTLGTLGSPEGGHPGTIGPHRTHCVACAGARFHACDFSPLGERGDQLIPRGRFSAVGLKCWGRRSIPRWTDGQGTQEVVPSAVHVAVDAQTAPSALESSGPRQRRVPRPATAARPARPVLGRPVDVHAPRCFRRGQPLVEGVV